MSDTAVTSTSAPDLQAMEQERLQLISQKDEYLYQIEQAQIAVATIDTRVRALVNRIDGYQRGFQAGHRAGFQAGQMADAPAVSSNGNQQSGDTPV